MVEIKICGITRLEDALAACEAGADALGFIFHPSSPRYIAPERARVIIRELSPLLRGPICRVGVLVASDLFDLAGRVDLAERGDLAGRGGLAELAEFCGLDLIQIHGYTLSQSPEGFPVDRLIRAVSPQTEAEALAAAASPARAILIDSFRRAPDGRTLYGGTGLKSDWELAARIAPNCRLILAGGLSADNVAEAITEVRPDALDFCSALEAAPGRKDPEKIRLVIETVHEAQRHAGRDGNARAKKKIFSRSEL